MKRLYKNSVIVSSDEKDNPVVLRDCVLCSDGEYIAYIGPQSGAPVCDEEKDMGGSVLMPGLVNVHGHGPMNLLRGAGNGLPLKRWLNEVIFPLEEKMTPDDIYAGELWAAAEMIAGGTTQVAEMYDFPRAAGQALLETGLKGNICRAGLSFSDTEEIPPNRFNECVDFVENWRDSRGRVTADFCVHSEYLTRERIVRDIAKACKQYGAGIHVHISETRSEHEECMVRHGGMTPVEYFNETGLLENRVYAAHCVWVTPGDIRIMSGKNITAVFNPSSNCKLASGFAPVNEIAAAGINLALGTDGCASNNNLNMFEEMHIASLIRKNTGGDPTLCTAAETIRMATVNGARALGRHNTGMLRPGMRADIIAVSLEAPHMYPADDILDLLVYSAQAGDVIMTAVDGDILYERGEYTTIDINIARRLFADAVSRIHA